MQNKETRGGTRSGAGRPPTNQKTFTVRCKPEVIEQVRKYAKQLSNKSILLLLLPFITMAQDRYSIQITTDNVIFQKGILYAGVEFNAEFINHIYIRPQLHYAALTDGYLETAAAMGAHFNYNRWNYNTGIKLGLIHRAATYPLFGVEGSTSFQITDKIAIGLRASYDARGDAEFYDGKNWVYNSQGFIKFTL